MRRGCGGSGGGQLRVGPLNKSINPLKHVIRGVYAPPEAYTRSTCRLKLSLCLHSHLSAHSVCTLEFSLTCQVGSTGAEGEAEGRRRHVLQSDGLAPRGGERRAEGNPWRVDERLDETPKHAAQYSAQGSLPAHPTELLLYYLVLLFIAAAGAAGGAGAGRLHGRAACRRPRHAHHAAAQRPAGAA
eukprot:702801-Prorocentrum_minimum.AAC.1